MSELYETDYVLVNNNNEPIDFFENAWLVYGDLEEVKEDAELAECNYLSMTKLSKYWQNKYIKYFEENVDEE